MLTLTTQEFEEAVADAQDHVPAELLAMMRNVVFPVEGEPPPGDPELLGVYDGTPLTERHDGWAGALPDRITIFAGPTLRMCQRRQEVLGELAVTVVHEIAQHFAHQRSQAARARLGLGAMGRAGPPAHASALWAFQAAQL